jgi:AcrR family transcriptional regulator
LAYHHGNLRRALLEQAAEVLRESGVAGLSLRDLARRSGVSHGAPARHFPDKAALLTALATDALERFQGALLGGMADAGKSAIDRYRAIGMGYVRFAVEHPAYFRLIASRPYLLKPDAEFDAAYQRLFETIREATIAAQQEGWAINRDPKELLIAAWSAVHGFATLWLEGGLEERCGPIDPEAAASAVIDILQAAGAGGKSPAKVSTSRGRGARAAAGARRSRGQRRRTRRSPRS